MRAAAATIGIFLLGLVAIIILAREVGLLHRIKPAGMKFVGWCAGLGLVFLLLGASWAAVAGTLAALAAVGILLAALHFSNRLQ
ncbi:hypothetical protein [Schleiferilactobacillus shenzhenensis]|uniref:Uncharacterized protein n=1 Tax=Schleiferilactobacillus shenzhenensis LY-73 TaxID=1231336 RepID=U4TMG6_9LACO|nr:hypothetical protein [Schleiferilactobacillus shenzhenensis]ERL65384.1 hypothetical protein L248_2783 [Schleiferilactobacillus shenzhenensis LY-73]